MLTLVVSHYIYLDRDQRYKLFNGETIETSGISIPVWFEKGSTSEPAQEVFCKYILKNQRNHETIKALKDGYEINLPQSVALINLMKTKTEEDGLESLRKLYEHYDRSLKLLDPEDGGAKWLDFKQYANMTFKKRKVEVVHSVEIKDKAILESTLN